MATLAKKGLSAIKKVGHHGKKKVGHHDHAFLHQLTKKKSTRLGREPSSPLRSSAKMVERVDAPSAAWHGEIELCLHLINVSAALFKWGFGTIERQGHDR